MKEERRLLKHCDAPESHTIAFYESHGGYQAAKKAVTSMAPDEIVKVVQASGLRGRGGAGFPTGNKWSFVPKDSPKPRYLLVNADESEPGTFKDKVLIEKDPHSVIEGSIISARSFKSENGYIYIRGEMPGGAKILQRAIDEAYAKGYLGKRIFGTDVNFDLTVHRGAGAYICGEETGQITSLEGDRGYPKIKPPFPAVEGYFRSPTIVNNVETLSNVPLIVANGPEWFRQFGTEKSPGTKLVGVCGRVERPGLFELPLGVPLREVLDMAGGVSKGRRLKAVIPGGSSAKVLTADEAMKVNLDFESLAAAGTMLGSGGVIVMDETTCMVDAAWNLARFYHHESCGQCTPCREGTGWLEKVLERLEHGGGKAADVDLVKEIGDNMCGRTICVLADAAAYPTGSICLKFRSEFEEHVNLQRCPMKPARKPEPVHA